MTTEKSLGPLTYLRIWHDNSGKGSQASWFLDKITVVDLQTGRRYFFICNRWLAVEEDDGMIERLLPVCGKSEVTNFQYLFASAAKKDLTDGHLWFSIMSRPTRSTFTRVQRLSCCLSLLFTTMIANCMWYRTEDNVKVNVGINVGPFHFTWHELYVGVMGGLVAFPINVIIVQIFRKTKRKEIDTLSGKRLMKRVTFRENPSHASVYKKISELPGHMESPSKLHKDNKDNGGGVVPFDQDSGVGSLLSLRADLLLDKPQGIAGHDTKDNIVIKKPSLKKRKGKQMLFLPHWFIYIGWVLVFLSVTGSAFFTILYSLEWGSDKSVQWLTSFIISFLQSVLFLQPAKVVLLALLLSLIFKRPDNDEDDDEIEPCNPTSDTEQFDKNINPTVVKETKYEPTNPTMLESARQHRLKELKMWDISREIIFYFIFVIILLIIAYGNRDRMSYFMQSNLRNHFFNNSQLTELESGFDNFWIWTQASLIPMLYPKYLYNNKLIKVAGTSSWLLSDLNTYKVGSPRLRHLRVKSELCTPLYPMSRIMSVCAPDYSWGAEERSSFGEEWSDANDSLTTSKDLSVWTYRTSDDLDGVPFYGRSTLYRGGGFVAELGSSANKAIEIVNYLKNTTWLDMRTRAVFVEMSLYNANINLFSMITIVMEFKSGGAVIVTPRIYPLRLYNYVGTFSVIVIACEVTFVAFLVFFMVKVIRSVRKEKRKFLKSYWNVIEICKLALCITGVAMYSYRLIFWNLALDSLLSGSRNKERAAFVNLQQLAIWDEIFNYITSVVVFISILKFVRLLRFNRRMALLGSTLKYASKDLIHFAVVFFIIFFSFGQFGYLVFGSALYNFSNFTLSVETLFTMMLGRFGYSDMKAAHELFGRLFFFAFMLLVYMVLFNVFVTVLVGAYQIVKKDNDKQSNEYEMVDFMLNRFKQFIGVTSDTVKIQKKPGPVAPMKPTCSETTLLSESSSIDDLNIRLDVIMQRIDALQGQDGQPGSNQSGVKYL